MTDYGEILRELRKEAHVSQTHVADALGVSTSIVWRFEKGLQAPTIEQLPRIAEALGIPVTYLTDKLFGEGSNASYGKLKKIEERLNGLSDSEKNAVLNVFDLLA